MAVEDKINGLRQFYLLIGDAIDAMKEIDRLRERGKRHKKTIEILEQKVNDLQVIVKGLETVSGKRVEVCPECLGAGAYQINGEVEECDKCESKGWIEKT